MEKVCFEAVARVAEATFYPGPLPAVQVSPIVRKAGPSPRRYRGPSRARLPQPVRTRGNPKLRCDLEFSAIPRGCFIATMLSTKRPQEFETEFWLPRKLFRTRLRRRAA